MKRILALSLILLMLAACVPTPEEDAVDKTVGKEETLIAATAAPTASDVTPSEEDMYLDAFLENAFEKDLKVFLEPQPTYGEDDPDRDIKECIDAYLYARNQILSDMHQPFSAMEAVSTMLSCCDPSFQMQAKVTIWYPFYLRKSNERNIDLSYAHFVHRTVYSSIVYYGDEATVTVQDAIQFQHVDNDVISASGDTHTIRVRRNGDAWKIVDDDLGAIDSHIAEGYKRFLSECPYSDPKETEQYIMERFANWGPGEHAPVSVTEEP